jgi:hypothetical protein
VSASWDSDVRAGASRVRGWSLVAARTLLVLVSGLVSPLIMTLGDGRPARAGPAVAGRDTPIVRQVRIGPAGIRVEKYGRGDTTRRGEARSQERVGDVIRVGRHGISVVSSEGESVVVGGEGRVHGPGLVVEAGDAGLVRVFADAHVPAGETIQGDVVAVFGSLDLEGTVLGDAVAVFGSVRLHPGAKVEGDAVAIGGVLDHPPGAQVSGQSVALGFSLPGWGVPTLTTLLTGVLLGWLATLFVGWMLALLFPERMLRIGGTASRHTAGSFFLGLLSAPLFVIALVILGITLVGIPFAILLFFLYPFAIWVGQIAASYVLGCKLLRRRPGEGGLVGPILAGTSLVALLFVAGAALAIPEGPARTLSLFFTLLGMLLLVGLSIIGTGALILSRVGSCSAEPGALAAGTLASTTPAPQPPAAG